MKNHNNKQNHSNERLEKALADTFAAMAELSDYFASLRNG